jgi:hypothetical protein
MVSVKEMPFDSERSTTRKRILRQRNRTEDVRGKSVENYFRYSAKALRAFAIFGETTALQ